MTLRSTLAAPMALANMKPIVQLEPLMPPFQSSSTAFKASPRRSYCAEGYNQRNGVSNIRDPYKVSE